MPLQPYPTGGQQLRAFFQYLQAFGFLDFLLPVLLIFTLIFGILQTTKIFKTPRMEPVKDAQGKITGYNPATTDPKEVADRRTNSILAIVIALSVTIPHTVGLYPPNADPITIISSFLPHTAVVIMAVFVVIMLLGFTGASMPNMLQLAIATVGVFFLLIVFFMNMYPGFLPRFDFLRDPAVQAFIIVLLTIALVGYWVLRPEKKGEGFLKGWVHKGVP